MRRAERRAGWWFIGPAALVLVLMLAFPLGYTVYLSFFEWFAAGGPPRFAGLANYVQIATDSRFLWAVGRTLLYTVLAVGFEVILGIALALLFERPFVGRGPARTLFLLPMVATPVAIALVWLLMFDPATGVLNYLLTLVGLPKSVWVNDRWLALPSLVLVDVWQWTPLVMLIVLGGLTSLPREPLAGLPLPDAADASAVHRGRRALPWHRRAEDVRLDLRAHARRPGLRVGNTEPLHLRVGVRLPAHGLFIGDARRVLRADPRVERSVDRRAETHCMTAAACRRRNTALLTLAVAVVLAVYLFPFYWMALASLKTQIQNFAFPPLFAFTPTLDNYRSVFVNNPFALYLWNSLLIGAASTLLGLGLGLPAAYGIARFKKGGVGVAFLIARIAPGIRRRHNANPANATTAAGTPMTHRSRARAFACSTSRTNRSP